MNVLIAVLLNQTLGFAQPSCAEAFHGTLAPELVEYFEFRADMASMPAGAAKSQMLVEFRRKDRETRAVFGDDLINALRETSEVGSRSKSGAGVLRAPKLMPLDPLRLQELGSAKDHKAVQALHALDTERVNSRYFRYENPLPYSPKNMEGVVWSADESVALVHVKGGTVSHLYIPAMTGSQVALTSEVLMSRDGKHFAVRTLVDGKYRINIYSEKDLFRFSSPFNLKFGPPDLFSDGQIGLIGAMEDGRDVYLAGDLKTQKLSEMPMPARLYKNQVTIDPPNSPHLVFRSPEGRELKVENSHIRFDSPTGEAVLVQNLFGQEFIVDLEKFQLRTMRWSEHTAFSPGDLYIMTSKMRGAEHDHTFVEDWRVGHIYRLESSELPQFIGATSYVLMKKTPKEYIIFDVQDRGQNPIRTLQAKLAGVSPSGKYLFTLDERGELKLWGSP